MAATPKKSPAKAKTPKKSPAKKSPKKSPAKAKTPKKSPAKAVKKTIAKSPKKEPGMKDPNAPKRASSAYFQFMNAERANLIKQYKLDSSQVADVARKAGEVWGKMSDKEKAPYQAKADKDKARYEKEIAKYKPDPSKFIAKKGSKKAKKDPNAPKRAASAYFVFMGEKRGDLIKQYKLDPSKVADVARKAGEVWGKMSDKDKAPYQAKADKDKARYAKEIAKYNK